MAYQSTTVLGPIILSGTLEGSERTSGQVTHFNVWDSRLTTSTSLTPTRIREIRNDATVQLARQAVVSPIIHTPWNYNPTKDAPAGAVDEIVAIFEPLRDWLLQNAVYGALDFGWAPFEIIYVPKDGRVTITRFKQLLQDFTSILVYVNSGEFAGFANEPISIGGVANNVIITLPYAINFNLAVEGTDWYGQSVSSVLDTICTRWNDVDKSANRYDKKIAGASWVVYYPVGETMVSGALTANDKIAKDILTHLEASGGVAVPDEIQEWLDDSVDRELKGKWRIELISAPNSSQSDFVDRQKYLDTLKIRAFGIPERSILEGQFGTKAEAEVHADIALSSIDTKHRLICDQINERAIRPLLRMNYGEKYENSVSIAPAPLVDAQFQTVKEIYRLLVQSPQIIAKEVQNIDVQALRDSMGIPSVPDADNDYSDIQEANELKQKQLNDQNLGKKQNDDPKDGE